VGWEILGDRNKGNSSVDPPHLAVGPDYWVQALSKTIARSEPGDLSPAGHVESLFVNTNN